MLFLPVAVLGPIGGALSDRADRRTWLLRATLAQAAVAALLAALASLHWLTVPLMSVLMLLTGCVSVLCIAGFNALIADLVDRCSRSRARGGTCSRHCTEATARARGAWRSGRRRSRCASTR